MSNTITPAQLAALTAASVTPNKYGAKRTWVEELGRSFASQHEAEQAVILRRREQAGEVRRVRYQVPYQLLVDCEYVCTYVADFVYQERRGDDRWRTVVADAKGYRTAVYRIKARLMSVCLGITVLEL